MVVLLGIKEILINTIFQYNRIKGKNMKNLTVKIASIGAILLIIVITLQVNNNNMINGNGNTLYKAGRDITILPPKEEKEELISPQNEMIFNGDIHGGSFGNKGNINQYNIPIQLKGKS